MIPWAYSAVQIKQNPGDDHDRNQYEDLGVGSGI